MSDELDDLKAAMKAATPTPDEKNRVDNLALGQKNFDALQGSRQGARPNDVRRPSGWLISGGRRMFHSLTSRGGLAATTALVAIGIVIVSPQGRSLFTPPTTISNRGESPKMQETPTTAPEPATKPADDALAGAHVPADPYAGATAGQAEGEAVMALERSRAPAKRSADYAQAPSVIAPSPEATSPERLDTEAFSNEDSAPVKRVADEPVSTFSIDVDTASYAVVRSSLMAGQLPPRDAVRVEEMLNYFPYDYPAPDAGAATPFKPTVTVMQTPWNADTQLVHIALQGKMPALDERPPLNLVFLIDTSGSMHNANKLPLLKQSFRLMLGQLRPEDKVAIVTYAGSAGQVLAPTAASERSTILAALDRLEAGGSTAGQDGLQQAYAVAENMSDDGDVSRVILATDGDFNVGLSDPKALEDFIAAKRDSGIYLSVLGFGRGNLDDATMQALAQKGNGTAAYIDTLSEAQKVLVDQLSGALFPIADDVKIQVEFNPAAVAEYRLIGYETRALRREDFNNDKVDAGEIGAGHAVTAIYEVTPVGSPAVLNDPLRYKADEPAGAADDELGFLRLRYKLPGESRSRLIEQPIPNEMVEPGTEQRFGAAIAGFGQLLRGSHYLGNWAWDDAIALANGALGEDPYGYRREAVSLMRLAQSLSQP